MANQEAIVEAARRFAAALDAEDYEAVRPLLAADCTYNTGKGVLVGPDAILASYRAAGDGARQKFDVVRYESAAAALSATEAVVDFTDHIEHGGAAHTYHCRQRLRLNAAGRIAAIAHEELPGERDRLRAFGLRSGVEIG